MSSCPSTETTPTFPPRTARSELHGDTIVAIGRRYDREPRETSGTLIDLTACGAKLSTSLPLAIEESVTLSFRFGEHGLNFMVDAQVRWTRPAPDSLWLLGCSFSPNLPEEYLECLAGSGLLERRRAPRRMVSLAATARWELGTDESLAVSIDDISSGGLRMIAPRGAEPGQRVLVEATGVAGKPLLIPARCHWQVESGNSFVLGCSFVDARGFARLSEAISASELPGAQVTRRRRNWLWPWL